jgi:hypothetical protein
MSDAETAGIHFSNVPRHDQRCDSLHQEPRLSTTSVSYRTSRRHPCVVVIHIGEFPRFVLLICGIHGPALVLRQVLNAYAILRDPHRRAAYDRAYPDHQHTGAVSIPVTHNISPGGQPPMWAGPVRWHQ